MAITVTNPAGARETRLTQDSVPAGVNSTLWDIVPTFDNAFTITSTSSGSTSANVSDGSLSFIDIWLVPSQVYTVRTKHRLKVGGSTGWTDRFEFTARGPLNSFEKYLALSGLGGVDNVITGL